MKIWVVNYSDGNGNETLSAFHTMNGVIKYRADLAREWWEYEFNEPVPTDMEDAELGVQYFHQVADLMSTERFHFEQVEVEE